MRVKEWMSANPVTVEPQTSVLNARRLLARYGIRHLPVVGRHHRLMGMVGWQDLDVPDREIAAAACALEWDLLIGRYRAVETIMRRPVGTAAPDDDIVTAAQLMLARGGSALPVVHDGAVVGVLSMTDCVRALLDWVSRRPAGTPAQALAEP